MELRYLLKTHMTFILTKMEPDTLSGFVATYAQMELLNNDDSLILQYLLRRNLNKPPNDDDDQIGEDVHDNEPIQGVSRPSFAEKCAIVLLHAADEIEEDVEEVRPNQLFTEQVVPLFSDDDFKAHFHMKRSTFEKLLQLLGKEGVAKTVYCGGRPPMTLERITLIFLSWLANQESHKEVAARFNVAKSTIHTSVTRVSSCLHRIARRFICWPEAHELATVAKEFEQRANFPGVVGTIGGTHIELDVPIVHHQKYNNDRQTKTMVLQAVCNANYSFTNCFAGFPGSADDACVFENSILGQEIQKNPHNFIPDEQYHLLGDIVYPLHSWLVVPFPDNGNLTEDQQRFNASHTQTLFTIITAFNQLKCRFRRLQYIKAKMDQVPGIIISICVLHNFCIEHADLIEGPLEFVEEQFLRLSSATGTGTELGYRKRLQLMAKV